MGRIVTLRPNALAAVGNGYWFKYPGSNAITSAYYYYLNDNDDGTYFYGIMSNIDDFVLDFGSYTLAANERCARARVASRIRGTSASFSMNLETWLRPVTKGDGGGAYYQGVYSGWTTVWNPWYEAEFNQTDVNAIQSAYRKLDDVTTPAVSEAYIELDIRTQPTVTITSPASGASLFPRRPTIQWTYNAQGDTVRAHQMKVFSSAQYSAGGFSPDTSASTWDSGRVSGAATSKQVGVDLAYGTTYRAYVKLATDFRGADWWSPWTYVQFTINQPPSVSNVATNPATPITTTNRPDITGTYTDPEGNIAAYLHVKVFSEAKYGAPGFNADTTVADYDSGQQGVVNLTSGMSFSWTVGTPLSANTNYKAYVRATEEGTPTRWSAWAASGTFIIQTAPGTMTDPPAIPEVISAVADSTKQRVVIQLQGRDNLLTRNQSTIDTGTVGWENDGNATLERDTVTFLQGGGSLSLTSLAAGDMRARTPAGATMPVQAGRTYTAMASLRAATAGRSCRVDIRWYDAAGAYLSPSAGSSITDTTTGWTQATLTAAAPSSATYAAVVVLVLATAGAGEVHYVDNISLAPGDSTTWTRGGLVAELGTLTDSFNRADSATSLGTADQGGAWIANAGTWGITGNRAYLASDTAGAVATLVSDHLADGYVEADITLSPTTNRAYAGLVFRALDQSNLLLVLLSRTTSYPDNLLLLKNDGGTWTVLANLASAGLAHGTTYRVRAEFYGGQIYVHLNDSLRISHLLLAGEHTKYGAYSSYGLYLGWGSTADDRGSRFDNFRAALERTQTLTLERSLDGGTSWAQVRGAVEQAPAGQLGTFYDFEVPPNVLARYRAVAEAEEAGNDLVSAWSATVIQDAVLTIDRWWLKDPVNPNLSMSIDVAPPFRFRRKERHEVFDPIGRRHSVIVTDGPKGIEGALNVWCKDQVTYDLLDAVLGTGRQLLLLDPLGRSWWVKFGDHDWELIRAAPEVADTAPIRHFHMLSLQFVEVGPPAIEAGYTPPVE